ncbi:hypothetical protein McanMca71_007252 [Microsporum canis]|uniref:Uncharacterized protein n=1 Tax=Arthroderma otae (strain ATCC MYA-4605 / CBS 113480) TaxID=554155 RepID=C5G107_ARTOC|nr:uncharacterized protein MCYG_08629 [Microsporum canis CBS 113480]EEQ35810.1 predicted protein [Microsporum canis CBS 113480]
MAHSQGESHVVSSPFGQRESRARAAYQSTTGPRASQSTQTDVQTDVQPIELCMQSMQASDAAESQHGGPGGLRGPMALTGLDGITGTFGDVEVEWNACW